MYWRFVLLYSLNTFHSYKHPYFDVLRLVIAAILDVWRGLWVEMWRQSETRWRFLSFVLRKVDHDEVYRKVLFYLCTHVCINALKCRTAALFCCYLFRDDFPIPNLLTIIALSWRYVSWWIVCMICWLNKIGTPILAKPLVVW